MNLFKYNLTEILTIQGKTFIIPSFQRPYKWEETHWNDLFCDIIRIYEKKTEHFMGAIVLQDKSNSENSPIVIDGQQRLSTLTMFLLSFARWVKDYNGGNVYLYNTTIKNYIVTYNKFDGSEIKRITLSNKHNNNKNYQDVIDSFYKPSGLYNMATNNVFNDMYRFFYDEINNYYNEIKENVDVNEFVNRFFTILTDNLRFVTIQLDKNEDANMIFETLNTRGKDLEHGELIRNYIFMHPKIKNAEEIYNNFWEPLEKYFEEVEEDKISNFSEFIRFFLYANKSDVRIIKNSHIYLEMKDYLDEYLREHEVIDLIKKVQEFKGYFSLVITPDTISKNIYSEKIIICLSLLKHLNVFVYTPIFLKLFEQYNMEYIELKTLEDIISLLTSYSTRLLLNGKKLPNKIIPEVILSITSFSEQSTIVEEIEDIINRQKSSPFYDNNALRKILIDNPVYSVKKKDFIKYILLSVFKAETKKNIPYNQIEGLTIEHIFPQTYTNWKQDLNEEQLEENINLMNTIGNLTLVNQSLNSKLSNAKFNDKKKELSKYCIWAFDREHFFGDKVGSWNADCIIERTDIIANYIGELLPTPTKRSTTEPSRNDLKLKVSGTVIHGKNQKDIYINALQKMYGIADKDRWNSINIKGCASSDKNEFTLHQREHLIQLGNIYLNHHASLSEKIRRIKKISQLCGIVVEIA